MEQNLTQGNREIEERIVIRKTRYPRKTIIIISSAIAFIVVICCYFTYSILNSTKIYPGIYVENTYIGGRSLGEATAIISAAYKSSFDGKSIDILSKGERITISLSDIEALYNTEMTVLEAYNTGRNGNVFKKIFDVIRINFKNKTLPLKIEINIEELKRRVSMLAEKVDIPGYDYKYKINGELLDVYKSKDGEEIDIDEAAKKIFNLINERDFTETNISPSFKKYKSIDFYEIYEAINCEAKDAHYEVDNYQVNIIPHRVGISFDKDRAKSALESSPNKNVHSITLSFKSPEKTTQMLKDLLFKDKLASYTTKFNSGNTSRSYNIELAASKINGIVIDKDDTFSFNNVVGERTQKTGFQKANVYFGEEIVEGVGGGICQVSTTLYNAILFSDLEVLNRVNHSMTVGYVPFGQDAAVAYGALDFKFKNNTGWPIKIIAKTDKGSISFDIIGNNEHPMKRVEIINNTLKTVPFLTEYIDSNSLYKGEKKVNQKGVNGYVVETYKVLKENGEVISKKLISTSSYKPIKEKILNGTKEKPTENKVEIYAEKTTEAFNQIPGVIVQDEIQLEQEQPAEAEAPIN